MDGHPSPQERIEAECARRGRTAVIDGCVALLRGGAADHRLIVALGGPHAEVILGDGPRDDQLYWLRVWAARGLLWVWDATATGADVATETIMAALTDEAWRVREMAGKVVARHAVGDALPIVADLRDDPVPRVRAVALRAVAVLTARRA
jgi:hypothetical protein